jgi:hypothetical protein
VLNADGSITLVPLPSATEAQRETIANLRVDGQWHEPQPGVFEKLAAN